MSAPFEKWTPKACATPVERLVSPPELWVANRYEIVDEVGEAGDERLTTGEEIGAGLEISLDVGDNADVFDVRSRRKARRTDVVITDAEGKSNARETLGVGSSVVLDDVAATTVGAGAINGDTLGVLQRSAEELRGGKGEVISKDNDGLGVGEVVAAGVGGGRILRAAGQKAGGWGKSVGGNRVATILSKGLQGFRETVG